MIHILRESHVRHPLTLVAFVLSFEGKQYHWKAVFVLCPFQARLSLIRPLCGFLNINLHVRNDAVANL